MKRRFIDSDFLVRGYEDARGFGCISYTKRAANPVFTSKDPVNSGLFAQFYSGLNFTGTFTGTDTTFLGTPDEL